ncbi:hypothetical protein BGZ98_008143 [Dissophora globulifera]|nr:hypothetical protein BGZ98_008143 [Dissophora globulifera]
MKFAKLLQDEVIPEWRKAYINYKQGKKYLKKAEAALDNCSTTQDRSPVPPTPTLPVSPPVPVLPSATTAPTTPSPTDAAPAASNTQGADASTLHIETQQNNGSTGSLRGDTTAEPGESNSSDVLLACPAPVYSPDLSPGSPTGTTPIIQPGRHIKGYNTIRIPPKPHSTPFPLSRHGAEAIPATAYPLSTTVDIPKSGAAGVPLPQRAQLLRRLTQHFASATGVPESLTRSRIIHVQPGDSIDDIMDQLLSEERDFFHFLDVQLGTVDAFYREKELEAVTKLKVLKQQLFVADEWKRRYDDRIAKTQAQRGWYQQEWSRMRHGIGNLIGDSSMFQEDVTLGPANRSNRAHDQHQHNRMKDTQETNGFSTGANIMNSGERMDQQQALRQRENGVVTETDQQHKHGYFPVDKAAYDEQLVLEDAEHRRQHLSHSMARGRIKTALYEFYRSLEMLKNYKILNNTGFVKIMKKYDKTAGWKASKLFIEHKLKPAYFMTSSVLADLFDETEELFIEKFANGNRRRGMSKLRIPDSKNQTHHSVTARVGVYVGLSLVLLIQGIEGALSKDRQAQIPYWDSLLVVYGGLFLTILFGCLFGLNMYAWAKSRINYKFIFEFDPRDNLDYHEFFELPVFFMLLLCVAFYFDFGWGPTAQIPVGYYYPLIVMCIVVTILFCPFPILNWGARRWFLQSIGRICVSGRNSVEFRDFFIADEMNSLAYSIEQFEFACLRRFRDTHEWYPHLLNSGKYFMTLAQIFAYFTFRHYGGTATKTVYIAVSLITSSYTYTWDVYMDWGLFQFGKHGGGAFGHPLLRAELVYSRQWVYYAAIVGDFLARFSWLARLIPMSLSPLVLSFILAFIEILRRWVWNFFRLENEHLNNCGQFRAIKDIPLPFHIHVEDEDEESEDESQEEEHNEQVQRGEDLIKHQNEVDVVGQPSQGDLEQPESIQSRKGLLRTGTGDSGGFLGRTGLSGAGINASQTSLHSNAPSTQSAMTVTTTASGSGPGRRAARVPSPFHPKPHPSPPSVSDQLYGIQRSKTFVDKAMVDAGFEENRREHLTAVNKFYDRRDFDSKIDDTPSFPTSSSSGERGRLGLRLLRARTRSASRGGHQDGLGIDTVNASGGEGGGASRGTAHAGDSGANPKKKSKASNIFAVWTKPSDNDDEYTDDDDDDDGNA